MATLSPWATSEFSGAMYSTRAVESDTVTASSRISMQSTVWRWAALAIMMTVSREPGNSTGRSSRNATISSASKNR